MADNSVTTAEVAKVLGVSKPMLARRVPDGRLALTGKTLGGYLRLDIDDLREKVR